MTPATDKPIDPEDLQIGNTVWSQSLQDWVEVEKVTVKTYFTVAWLKGGGVKYFPNGQKVRVMTEEYEF